MEKILLPKSNKKVMLLGNDAVVRGALESGVQFVSTYPGTPASEIGNVFSRIAKKAGVYFEFSTNEKVALEAGAGASFCGLRTLVAMKHFGLNVASDFLMPLVYSGTVGGMVILVADDPGCWSSAQSEENTRAFAALAHIPILEPSSPQECKDFVKFAFDLSEKLKIPVMIRTTTRVAHQTAPVELKAIKKGKRTAKFVKRPHQFITMPPRVLSMHKELLEKIKRIEEISNKSEINFISNKTTRKKKPKKTKSFGIICSGISYLYVMEGLIELDLDIPVLKLGFFYPLPKAKVRSFIKRLKRILVVEELEPYLEKEVKILAKDLNPTLKVFGKNVLCEVGELKPEYVMSAISKSFGKKSRFNFTKHLNSFNKLKNRKHIPRLCSNCPYHFVFSAVKRAVNSKKVIFGGEIGCYMLAGLPPYQIQDYLFCMGSSVGVAHGIKKALEQNGGRSRKLIAFVGDSSFFHAGIPALINASSNNSNPLVIIMDNGTTAMTGRQPHPGVGRNGMGEERKKIEIEDVVRSFGVKHIKVIDPVMIREFEKTVKDFVKKKEVSVIIARHPCQRLK